MSSSTAIVVGRDGGFGSTTKGTTSVNASLAESLKGHFVGPMPISKFLQEHLPPPTKQKMKLPNVDFAEVVNVSKEVEMYVPFATAVRPLLPDNAEVIISAENDSETSLLRPDIGLRILSDDDTSRHVQSGRAIIREAFNFTNTCLVIELKLNLCDDPFVDDLSLPSCENDSITGMRSRGQLAHYASEVFTQQHRLYLYQVIIFGSRARFLLWDRSGAIFTASFDYLEKPRLLATFFWRYTRTTSAARGWDPSVTPATEKDTEIVRHVLCTFIKENREAGNGEFPGAYVSLDEAYPVYRIRIANSEGLTVRVLYAGRFFYATTGPCGRGTRAYLAVCMRQRKVYVLKDTWQVEDPSCLDELSAYDLLTAAGVPYILPLMIAGDVLSGNFGPRQLTTVQDVSKHPFKWRAPCSSFLRRHVHFRLVQNVAYPIQCLKNSQELIKVFHDVATCVAMANTAGILHRDISIGNILFVRTDVGVIGILNDWDHAQQIHDMPDSQGYFRSATRQFMSIALLKSPLKIHELADDLESLFWSLVFAGLHYVAHGDRSFLVHNHPFDAGPHAISYPSIPVPGSHTGRYRILTESLLKNFSFRSSRFKAVINYLCDTWRNWYIMNIMDSEFVLPEALDKARRRVTSPTWLMTLLEEAHSDSEGWVAQDIVADQFPPLTLREEKTLLAQELTATFDTSHLPKSVRSRTTGPTSTRLTQSFLKMEMVPSTSTVPARRLEEISDDSGDEYTDGPARKKRKFEAFSEPSTSKIVNSETTSLPRDRLATRLRPSKLPRVQPRRIAKRQ